MVNKGAVFNRKLCLMVHWVKGKLFVNIPDSRDARVICLLSSFRDRQVDIAAYRGDVCN